MADLNDVIRLLKSGRTRSHSTIQELGSRVETLEDPSLKGVLKAKLAELITHAVVTAPCTVLGFFGGTGHGKSSTLNAMFPTIRLPTSDSNACTPIPITIHGKVGEGTDVEVIFLDKAEFEADRKLTIENVFAVQEHGYSEETAAYEATARAKLNALYPKLTIDKFSRTQDELETHLTILDDKNGVQDYIRDGRLKFTCNDANDFAEKIKKFGASAELGSKETVILWPIVKEIVVELDAEELKQRLVLVDIPGTMDTEVARAEVASGWMKRCTSPLILASCDRAIDSPDVWDRIGEILWHDKMTGKNSRITIILTQIDKGTLEEGEKHVAGSEGYCLLKSGLVAVEEELGFSKNQEQTHEAARRQIQNALSACLRLLVTEGSVKEPSWWSLITTEGWAKTSTVSFETDEVCDPLRLLDRDAILAMIRQLTASPMEDYVPTSSSGLADKILGFKQEMRHFRTQAKVEAIRLKMINKIAAKMAEQASTLAQDRGDDDFDSDTTQPTAFLDLARESTTVIGICPPAAVAVNARNAGIPADSRYVEWSDIESTGLPALERLFETLTNETVASHEISCAVNIKNGLLDLQILSSFDQNLPKGKWWTSDGRECCDAVFSSIEDVLKECTSILQHTLKSLNKSAFKKGINDTIHGVPSPGTQGTGLSNSQYILKPLKAKVEGLREIHPSTYRAILHHRGVYSTRRNKNGGSPKAYDLNADVGHQLRKVVEAYFQRDARKAIYHTRAILTNQIKDSFSQLHRDVQKMCTTPDAPNNHLLQLCQQANQQQQEVCINYITALIHALIEKAVDLPRNLVPSEIKKHMDGLYNDIHSFTSERKAAKSRGDSLSGNVTATMRDKLENFLNKEAENMLHKVTGALETGFSTILDGTLGTAVSKSGESRVSKAVSALHQSYTRAFTNIQRTGRACKDDIAVLKAISREATNESSLVHSLAEQVQTTVPRLKRDADADLASASKRLNVKGTDRQPIEIN